MSEVTKLALPKWATAILLTLCFGLLIYVFNKWDNMFEKLIGEDGNLDQRLTVIEQNLPIWKKDQEKLVAIDLQLSTQDAQFERRMTIVEQTLINLPLNQLVADLAEVKKSVASMDKQLFLMQHEASKKQ